MTITLREFIIVGQCQGAGFTLWDIAPAPTDPTRCAVVLEELGVEAMDAFGSVNTEHGASGREALDNFLAFMRVESGLDDYALTADSQTEKITECDAVRAHASTARGPVNITATVEPGPDSLTITGAHGHDTGVHGRIQNGITRAGITFPAGEVAVRIDDHRGYADTLDLATACAILGAAGQIDRYALDRIVCLGEMSWDGFLSPVFCVEKAVRAAHAAGYRTVLVPAVQVMTVRRMGLDGLNVIGARHMTQALDAVNKLADQA